MDSFTIAVHTDILKSRAGEAGINPNATSGTLPEVDHVQLSYMVTATTANMTAIEFTVIKKPFYVSLDMIKSHIGELLHG